MEERVVTEAIRRESNIHGDLQSELPQTSTKRVSNKLGAVHASSRTSRGGVLGNRCSWATWSRKT